MVPHRWKVFDSSPGLRPAAFHVQRASPPAECGVVSSLSGGFASRPRTHPRAWGWGVEPGTPGSSEVRNSSLVPPGGRPASWEPQPRPPPRTPSTGEGAEPPCHLWRQALPGDLCPPSTCTSLPPSPPPGSRGPVHSIPTALTCPCSPEDCLRLVDPLSLRGSGPWEPLTEE